MCPPRLRRVRTNPARRRSAAEKTGVLAAPPDYNAVASAEELSMTFEIIPLTSLSIDGLESLVEESEAEGIFPLGRLVREWGTGENRFDQPGETLFAAVDEDSRLLGVCGLNRDPYLDDPDVGRVRHLYVARAGRGRGVGGRLVRTVIEAARGRFTRLRLRTDCSIAARFYQSLGFERLANDPTATHALRLESGSGR